MYTWGANAGQLGHLKGDRTVSQPKLVSSLSGKKIRNVATCDGAVVIHTKEGELIALHE